MPITQPPNQDSTPLPRDSAGAADPVSSAPVPWAEPRASSKTGHSKRARGNREARAENAAAEGLEGKLLAAEQELDALHAELERLHRLASIGTIAGMIAHEFNNILTPILSYSQMALAAPEDRALVQKSLERTLAGSERAAKIADAILGFVRDDAARAGEVDANLFHVEQTVPPEASVAAAVDDALTCLGRDAARGDAGTRVQIPRGLRAAIQPIALQQVLVNLVLNARNAMRGSGGVLQVSASRWLEEPATARGAADSRRGMASRRTPETERAGASAVVKPLTRGSWVCIVVRDTGRGMDAARLAQLFTPFATSSTGGHRGTGLGMVITKRLVERAGGWLTVESSLGRGTTTTIVLPEAKTKPKHN